MQKLNESNYGIWKYRVEMLLAIKEPFLAEENQKEANDGQGRVTIGLPVEDSQLIVTAEISSNGYTFK